VRSLLRVVTAAAGSSGVADSGGRKPLQTSLGRPGRANGIPVELGWSKKGQTNMWLSAGTGFSLVGVFNALINQLLGLSGDI
jgi:hypothetical protein